MKCEVCSELLEEYLDDELPAEEEEQINAHLITCADCSSTFGALTAEQELFARYERDIEVPPFLWTRIAQHTVAANPIKAGWRARPADFLAGFFATPSSSFAGAIAILVIAIAVGVVYLMSRQSAPKNTIVKQTPLPKGAAPNQALIIGSNLYTSGHKQADPIPEPTVSTPRPKRKLKPAIKHNPRIDQSDVLSSDLGYLDMDDQDTAKHIEQTQNLLRSIRNVSVSDGDEEIDVSYDKALSRRLLNENIVLRRDAEMKAKFPTKALLADLEPFLIDIANLPDHARPEEVRVIKERVQKTEIVAALMGYQGQSLKN